MENPAATALGGMLLIAKGSVVVPSSHVVETVNLSTLKLLTMDRIALLRRNLANLLLMLVFSACKLFIGSTSCGWSDKLVVTCKKITGATMAFMVPRRECI